MKPPPTPLAAAGTGAKGGNRLGVVLSGGGSRGIAHIGVLRALLEHGIHPESVAGVSAGAVVGALYAAGHTPAGMLDFFQTVDPYRIANMTFFKPGLLDSLKLVPDFRRYFPGDSFEGLGRKLRILAADLFSGEAKVFDSGELIRPLLASSSVPMVFSPIEVAGRWYSDGGVIDNFPVQLLDGCCDVVLGVHVSPIRAVTDAELGNSYAVLERILEVGMFSKSLAKFEQCDVVIRPDDLGYGMFDTNHYRETEAAGHRAAISRMDEIRRLLD
jgi:NTE family protein